MTELFLDKFRALVPTYFDEPWVQEDGLSEDELAQLREDQDFPLPMALREFYLAVGASEDLMEAFHYVWDPDELEIEDGYLLFMEDVDEKFVWGIKADQLNVPDPIVWRRNNARASWKNEEGTFSEFMLDMFDWVFDDEDDQ